MKEILIVVGGCFVSAFFALGTSDLLELYREDAAAERFVEQSYRIHRESLLTMDAPVSAELNCSTNHSFFGR